MVTTECAGRACGENGHRWVCTADDWLDTVTVSPAKALGLAWDGRIAPGCSADLLVLSATGEHELIGPRGRQRTVIRAGQRLESNEQ